MSGKKNTPWYAVLDNIQPLSEADEKYCNPIYTLAGCPNKHAPVVACCYNELPVYFWDLFYKTEKLENCRFRDV